MSKKRLVWAIMVGVCFALTQSVMADFINITVDGLTSDWGSTSAIDTDADDVATDSLDFLAGYAANDLNNLYFRNDMVSGVGESGAEFTIIYLDTDQSSATGFNAGWWATGADYRLYCTSAGVASFEQHTGGSGDDTWSWDPGSVAEAASGSVQEWSVAFSALGLSAGDSLNILWRSSVDDAMDEFGSALTYTSVVPEPATLGLLGVGALVAMLTRKCRCA